MVSERVWGLEREQEGEDGETDDRLNTRCASQPSLKRHPAPTSGAAAAVPDE